MTSADHAANIRLGHGLVRQGTAGTKQPALAVFDDAGGIVPPPPASRRRSTRPRHWDHRLISSMAERSSTRRKWPRMKSPRTTKLYDRTKERLIQEEVERIRL
jgi:hypothetical protein